MINRYKRHVGKHEKVKESKIKSILSNFGLFEESRKRGKHEAIKSKKGKHEATIIKGKSKRRNYKRENRIKAALLSVVTASSILLLGAKKTNKNENKVDDSAKVSYEQVSDLNNEDSLIVNSSALSMINSLNEEQSKVWNKVYDFQNYFNLTAAPSIEISEDNGARLYLTAEECIALYSRLNAKNYSAKELSGIFGSDSYYFTNERLDENFINACKIINYYYLTATNESGLSMIFDNEADSELFSDIENMVLSYNNNINSTINKNKLHNEINSMFFDGSIENAKVNNPGVISAVGTAMVPILYINGVFDKNELENLVTMNETVTCDILRSYVKEATLVEDETENQDILNELPDEMNKELINVKSRNINFDARYRLLHQYGKAVSGYKTTTSVSREKAVSMFGESEVKKQEEAAKKAVEEMNKDANEYGSGLDDVAKSGLYDDVYDYVLENGTLPSNYNLPTNGDKEHDAGVTDGASKIIEHAYEDATLESETDKEFEDVNEYIDDDSLPDDFAKLLK